MINESGNGTREREDFWMNVAITVCRLPVACVGAALYVLLIVPLWLVIETCWFFLYCGVGGIGRRRQAVIAGYHDTTIGQWGGGRPYPASLRRAPRGLTTIGRWVLKD